MSTDRIDLTAEGQSAKFHPAENKRFYWRFMPHWGFCAALSDRIALIGRPRPAVAGPVEHSEDPSHHIYIRSINWESCENSYYAKVRSTKLAFSVTCTENNLILVRYTLI